MAGAVCPMTPGETDWRSAAEKPATYRVKPSTARMNGRINGRENGCHVNGHQGNGVANFHHPANGGRPHGDSDDEEFHSAEVTRTGSSSEDFFDAAEDGLEEYLSSDEDFQNAAPSIAINGSSRAAPTRGRRTSYRDLVARIQEESRRRTEAEEALSACTKRLDGVRAAVAAAQKALDEAALVVLIPAGSGDAQGGNESSTASIEEAGNEDAGSRSADGSQEVPTEADTTGSAGAETVVNGIGIVETDTTGSVDVEGALARAVAAAMKRGEEHLISDKQQADLVARKEAEVSRLRDKLQYWERMNQEMAEKNNEAIEHMRAHRRRWNLIWKALGVGAAVTVGVGVMVAVAHLSSSSSSSSSSSGDVHGNSNSNNGASGIGGSVSAAAE